MNFKLWERIVYVYIVRSICSFGILGNSFNLLTLLQSSLYESPYTYLTAMTAADLVMLIIFVGIGCVRCGNCHHTTLALYSGYIYEVFVYLPFANIAVTTSSWITVVMTIERFIFVRVPFLAKKVCNRNKARLMVLIIFIFSVGLNIPRFFFYNVIWKTEIDSNLTSLRLVCRLNSSEAMLCAFRNGVSLAAPTNYSERLMNTSDSNNNNSTNYRGCGGVNFSLNLVNDTTIEWKDDNETVILLSTENVNGTTRSVLSYAEEDFVNGTLTLNSSVIGEQQHPNDVFVMIQENLTMVQNSYVKPRNYTNGPDIKILFSLNISDKKQAETVLQRYPCLLSDRPGNKTEVLKKLTQFGTDYADVYQAVIAGTEMITFVLLVIFNIGMVVVLHKFHKKRKKMVASIKWGKYSKGRQRDQQRLTMTLLCITCIATLNSFANVVNTHPIATAFYSPELQTIFSYVANLILLFSNSINFLVYAALNSRFKKEFVHVIKSCLCCRRISAVANRANWTNTRITNIETTMQNPTKKNLTRT